MKLRKAATAGILAATLSACTGTFPQQSTEPACDDYYAAGMRADEEFHRLLEEFLQHAGTEENAIRILSLPPPERQAKDLLPSIQLEAAYQKIQDLALKTNQHGCTTEGLDEYLKTHPAPENGL